MYNLATFRCMTSSPKKGEREMTNATQPARGRQIALFVAACAAALMFAIAPASAQTYSDNSDNSTNQDQDTNDPGDNGSPDDDSNSTNVPDDDGVVAQVDEGDGGGDLAFTGADSLSLALIGFGVAGAGVFLVMTSRRKVEQPA